MVLGANPAVWMYASGPAFASVLSRNGTERAEEDRRSSSSSSGWGATMVLTEPDAGSDVGAGRTKAIPQADGTWHIEGVKRFITCGEHDLTENIVHLRAGPPVEGAGGPGTKGLSLFLVPEVPLRPARPASCGERNGVYVTNVEHKMGLKVSTTCEMTFGDGTTAGQGLAARRRARRHRARCSRSSSTPG